MTAKQKSRIERLKISLHDGKTNIPYETNINSIVFPLSIELTLENAVYLYAPYI